MDNEKPRDAEAVNGRRRADLKRKTVRAAAEGSVAKRVGAFVANATSQGPVNGADIQPTGSTTDQKSRGRRKREEPDASTAQVRLYGQKLMAMRKRIATWRTGAARKAFELGDRWRELQEHDLSRDQLVAFLASECQIPRSEVLRHIRLAEAFGEDEKKLLIDKGVAVNVLLDLAVRDENLRREALAMIRSGRCIDAKHLRALSRDLKHAEAARTGAIDETRQAVLINAAAAKARKNAKAWLRELKELGESLYALAERNPFDHSHDEIDEKADALAAKAQELRASLPQIAGDDFFANAARPKTDQNETSGCRWARVDRALQCIAARDIAHEQCDWANGESLVVDIDLVWEIAWAFGYDEENAPREMRRRMRIEGRIPLEVDPSERDLRPETERGMTVLEICAGAGGQALGLEAAGFHHVGLVELDPDAAATMRHNQPDWPVIESDVRGIDLSRFKGVDLLAGGIPCQPFSSSGRRKGRDDERDLFPEALRLVKELRPRAVMFENVTGLFNFAHTTHRLQILAQLQQLGYDAEWRVLSGIEFGLSQKRNRAILVGFRRGAIHRFRWPEAVTSVATAPSVGETLRDLMAANGWEHADRWARTACGHCLTLIGGSKLKSGIDLAQEKSREAWRRVGIDPNGRAYSAPPAGTPANHMPKLTLEMMARLQDFPDTWTFQGPDLHKFHQIANAFPPRMARTMGLAVMRALTGSSVNLERALATPVFEPRKPVFRDLNRCSRAAEFEQQDAVSESTLVEA
jgi:DNA (cytosine-5)-methyltransferase 1